jgi:Tfp pilus assembly protein PilV
MHFRKLKTTNGVSILEVLVAMLILSVALLLLMNMAMVALDGNDWSHRATLVTQLTQQKLEELRGSGNPTSGSDIVNGVTRTWTVTNAGSHLRNVQLEMVWSDVKSKVHTDTMTCLIKTDSV